MSCGPIGGLRSSTVTWPASSSASTSRRAAPTPVAPPVTTTRLSVYVNVPFAMPRSLRPPSGRLNSGVARRPPIPGTTMTAMPPVPFRVAFDPDAVDDLQRRLRATRWPEPETVDDWSQGIPLAFVQDLTTYWCDEYDFAAAEARMNAWPQFTTRIDDLDIHFVHALSPEPDA